MKKVEMEGMMERKSWWYVRKEGEGIKVVDEHSLCFVVLLFVCSLVCLSRVFLVNLWSLVTNILLFWTFTPSLPPSSFPMSKQMTLIHFLRFTFFTVSVFHVSSSQCESPSFYPSRLFCLFTAESSSVSLCHDVVIRRWVRIPKERIVPLMCVCSFDWRWWMETRNRMNQPETENDSEEEKWRDMNSEQEFLERTKTVKDEMAVRMKEDRNRRWYPVDFFLGPRLARLCQRFIPSSFFLLSHRRLRGHSSFPLFWLPDFSLLLSFFDGSCHSRFWSQSNKRIILLLSCGYKEERETGGNIVRREKRVTVEA